MKNLRPLENVVRLLGRVAIFGALATVLFVVWGLVLHGFPGGAASALVAACAGITVISLYERQKWARVLARARAERDQAAGSAPS
jgi:hypothetical protein